MTETDRVTRLGIWGKTYGLEQIIRIFRSCGAEVCAVFDNDPDKWGQSAAGCPVVSPERLHDLAPDAIVVLSMAYDAITKQAEGMGFPRERVVRYAPGSTLDLLETMTGKSFLSHFLYRIEDGELVTEARHYSLHGKVVADIPASVPLERQHEIVEGLLRAFNAARGHAASVPPLYRSGENWRKVLERSWGEFYRRAERNDVAWCAEVLAGFCRHPISNCIIGGAKGFNNFKAHRGYAPWLQHNFEVWTTLAEGSGRIADVAMPPIGNPYGYDLDGHVVNWNSFVNHGRAYRCLDLLKEFEHPVIAEIGGGFGGFAYHLLRTGRTLTYVDFDLPENLLTSSYYQSMAFPEKRILLYESPDMPLEPSMLKQYDAVMLPNFMLPRMQERSADFFINTISFSEMEYSTISEYFSQIDRIGSGYFYHENLSCHPEYKGFPASVFPRFNNFKRLFVSFSPWQGLDAYRTGHSYLEHLFVRRSS